MSRRATRDIDAAILIDRATASTTGFGNLAIFTAIRLPSAAMCAGLAEKNQAY
jgi:hypothetical protein